MKLSLYYYQLLAAHIAQKSMSWIVNQSDDWLQRNGKKVNLNLESVHHGFQISSVIKPAGLMACFQSKYSYSKQK